MSSAGDVPRLHLGVVLGDLPPVVDKPYRLHCSAHRQPREGPAPSTSPRSGQAGPASSPRLDDHLRFRSGG